MTEAEWLASGDPLAMLRHRHAGLSDRKRRLYLVGCARHAWAEIESDAIRRAALVAERFADGAAPVEGMQLAHHAASAVRGQVGAAVIATTAGSPAWALGASTDLTWALAHGAPARHAALLRDVLGNPFCPVSPDPSWRTSTVVALAAGIYEERAFDRLPILADALQDAGCDNADILNHCRSDGPHVRGCWVVDLLLGKQ
jgi:hypothetical protein